MLTGETVCYWMFLFSHRKVSDANIAIIVKLTCLWKTRLPTLCIWAKLRTVISRYSSQCGYQHRSVWMALSFPHDFSEWISSWGNCLSEKYNTFVLSFLWVGCFQLDARRLIFPSCRFETDIKNSRAHLFSVTAFTTGWMRNRLRLVTFNGYLVSAASWGLWLVQSTSYRPYPKDDGRLCFHRRVSVHISWGGYPILPDWEEGGSILPDRGVPHPRSGQSGTPSQVSTGGTPCPSQVTGQDGGAQFNWEV